MVPVMFFLCGLLFCKSIERASNWLVRCIYHYYGHVAVLSILRGEPRAEHPWRKLVFDRISSFCASLPSGLNALSFIIAIDCHEKAVSGENRTAVWIGEPRRLKPGVQEQHRKRVFIVLA